MSSAFYKVVNEAQQRRLSVKRESSAPLRLGSWTCAPSDLLEEIHDEGDVSLVLPFASLPRRQ